MIRPPHSHETDQLVRLAQRTGLFSTSEADALLRSTLDDLHAGALRGPNIVRVVTAEPGDVPLGWAYAAESAHAPGVWDVWWIGVDPGAHGRGLGKALLTAVEAEARAAGARVIVIETSDGIALSRARAFYPARGYVERGRIPDFYAPGEAKITFSKTVA